MMSFPADLPGPFFERYERVADQAARDIIGQAARGIEFGLRLANEHLGLVQRMHIEKDTAFTQIVLRSCRAGHPGTRPIIATGLPAKG